MRTVMKLIKACCFAVVALLAMPSYAAADPMVILQSTSDHMLTSLKTQKATIKNNPQIVYNIITHDLLPHVDTNGMARSVLGRQVWESTGSEQRTEFTKQFTRLLIRNYAIALSSYSDQEVKFLPMREAVAGQTHVQIDSVILQPNGPKIPVTYRMALVDNDWKVYDIIVSGVSFLQSYRSQFSAIISQQGFPSLMDELKKQNIKQITKIDDNGN